MDDESGESMEPMEEVPLIQLGEAELERLVRGSCPRRAAALGCSHAGCLQLSHVLTADPSADGRRSPRVELPSRRVAYRLAAPGAIVCSV